MGRLPHSSQGFVCLLQLFRRYDTRAACNLPHTPKTHSNESNNFVLSICCHCCFCSSIPLYIRKTAFLRHVSVWLFFPVFICILLIYTVLQAAWNIFGSAGNAQLSIVVVSSSFPVFRYICHGRACLVASRNWDCGAWWYSDGVVALFLHYPIPCFHSFCF